MGKSFLIVIALLVGCSSSSTGSGQTSTTHPKPQVTSCSTACFHLSDMNCEEAMSLPDGTTCENFCLETQSLGHGLNISCAIKSKSCESFRRNCK